MSPKRSGNGGPDRLEYVVLALGLLFAAITIGLGSYEKLWATLDPQLRGSLTLACSMSSLLVGFLSASYVQRGRLSKDLLKVQNNIIAEQKQAKVDIIAQQRLAAQVSAISVHNGTEGMTKITRLVLEAEVALNTIILPEVEGKPRDDPLVVEWNKAVIQAVQKGTSFRDVASESCEKFVKERASALTDMKYAASVVPATIAFLNFIVLKYRNGTKEVWFGWIGPRVISFAQPCFRCSETEVVTSFEKLQETLFESGREVRSDPPDAAAARTKC